MRPAARALLSLLAAPRVSVLEATEARWTRERAPGLLGGAGLAGAPGVWSLRRPRRARWPGELGERGGARQTPRNEGRRGSRGARSFPPVSPRLALKGCKWLSVQVTFKNCHPTRATNFVCVLTAWEMETVKIAAGSLSVRMTERLYLPSFCVGISPDFQVILGVTSICTQSPLAPS